MPLYSYSCSACKGRVSLFRRIEARDDVAQCEECRGALFRVFEAPAVHAQVALFPEYISPASGKPISSREQRREDMKRAGVIDWEPGIKEQIAKKREAIQKEETKKLDKTVDEVVTAFNTSGKLDNV